MSETLQFRSERPCPECGALVEYHRIGDPETASERAPIGEARCPNGHVMARFLRPDQAALDRGRELAERYGW